MGDPDGPEAFPGAAGAYKCYSFHGMHLLFGSDFLSFDDTLHIFVGNGEFSQVEGEPSRIPVEIAAPAGQETMVFGHLEPVVGRFFL